MNTYFIKTYGCQMNIHESEKLSGMLKSLGYQEAKDIFSADVVVFNTCCIRDGVEQKILGNIGMLKSYAQQNKDLIVAVCGCMSQEEGKAQLIMQKFPFVKFVFGTHNINEFKDYLQRFLQTKKRFIEVWSKEKDICEDVDTYRTSGYNAWVNIMYGCNNFCTYCIVPYVRGRERSRDKQDIINECKSLISQGYKTITLLGQNVNSYGKDLSNGTTFAQLLQEIANLEGDFRIKFLTSHPKDLTDDIIAVMRDNTKISKQLHLPVQSGSTSILKAMNRRYTRQQYLNLVNKIKAAIPNISLTTDIIVGFPGETQQDFDDTCSLIKQADFGGVFAFMYSRRSGTVADKMTNQIDADVKRKRVNEVLKISKALIEKQNKALVNQTCEALIISQQKPCQYTAELYNGKDVLIETTKQLKPLTYVNVKVVKYLNKKLICEV